MLSVILSWKGNANICFIMFCVKQKSNVTNSCLIVNITCPSLRHLLGKHLYVAYMTGTSKYLVMDWWMEKNEKHDLGWKLPGLRLSMDQAICITNKKCILQNSWRKLVKDSSNACWERTKLYTATICDSQVLYVVLSDYHGLVYCCSLRSYPAFSSLKRES